jgi:glycerol-3-phosphate dehydrogenase (NAD(P)+)
MSIGVIGAGAWGTALAQLLSDQEPVMLWTRDPARAVHLNNERVNNPYLPDVLLSPKITATADVAALGDCDALLVVTPAQHMREVLSALNVGTKPIILCAKGIEAGSMLLMSEVAAVVCPDAPIAILSGPTFAAEVAKGLPTAVTLASADAALVKQLAARLARPYFRPYVSDDVIGAEIGGAVKNVLAIACGVTSGAQLGQNAQAALIARGFAEMMRFGLAKGARAETLSGLAGLGDLVLTCSSTQSRNYALGVALGTGKRAEELLAELHTVAEGAFTAPVLQRAARECGVEMPVVDAVCALLSGWADVREVMTELMARPLKGE